MIIDQSCETYDSMYMQRGNKTLGGKLRAFAHISHDNVFNCLPFPNVKHSRYESDAPLDSFEKHAKTIPFTWYHFGHIDGTPITL